MRLKFNKVASRAGVERGGTVQDEVKGDGVAQTVARVGLVSPEP